MWQEVKGVARILKKQKWEKSTLNVDLNCKFEETIESERGLVQKARSWNSLGSKGEQKCQGSIIEA